MVLLRSVLLFLLNLVSTQGQGRTQPAIRWVPEFFPGGQNRPGREVDHSPPFIAVVKNERNCYLHCLRVRWWRAQLFVSDQSSYYWWTQHKTDRAALSVCLRVFVTYGWALWLLLHVWMQKGGWQGEKGGGAESITYPILAVAVAVINYPYPTDPVSQLLHFSSDVAWGVSNSFTWSVCEPNTVQGFLSRKFWTVYRLDSRPE